MHLFNSRFIDRHSACATSFRAHATSLLFGTALTLLLSASASAQQLPIRPDPLPAYGRSVASIEDSSATVVNPANLTFLPGGELRWTGVFLDEAAEIPEQGQALGFGVSSPGVPLGFGIRMDWLDPPLTSALDNFGRSIRYQWLTLGLALGGPHASLGFSWQRSFSNSALVHGLSVWTAAMSSRPSHFLGFSLLAQGFNEPQSNGGLTLHRAYTAGFAVRPARTRAVELGLEAQFVDTPRGYWVPRATLGIDIPYVGRLRGEFSINDVSERELEERTYQGAVNLALWGNGMGGSVELAGGAAFGNGLGSTAGRRASNVHAELAMRGWREPTGAEVADYALKVRLEETPDPREHVRLLRRLWDVAKHESSARAVVFELRAAPAASFAHVEELRDAVYYLRKRGKKVLCHLESGDSAALYFCASADRTLVSRAGGLAFAGLRMRYLHLKNLLDNIHVRADFVRIGEHKSAPEQFTRSNASESNRADRIDLLQQLEASFTGAMTRDKNLGVAEFRERIKKGPFTAKEAHQAGLVDGIAYQDELEDQVRQLTGLDLPLLDDRRAHTASKYFGPHQKLAILYVDRGEIIQGRSRSFPLIGMDTVGSYTLVDALESVRDDPAVAAVVLRIESPGGSGLAADAIWRAVERTNQIKPVVVSMGGLAASGGYYLAVPSRRIFANPSSITGSIGVYYGKADTSELLRKVGINIEVYKTAASADADAFYRPFSEAERTALRGKLQQFYDLFVERVASGRNMEKAKVLEVAQGRVWTGGQAVSNGLADEIGGLRQAIEHARALSGLPEYAPIIELPERESSIIGKLLGVEGLREAELSALPPELVEVARALAPLSVHSSSEPLMRVELIGLDE